MPIAHHNRGTVMSGQRTQVAVLRAEKCQRVRAVNTETIFAAGSLRKAFVFRVRLTVVAVSVAYYLVTPLRF